MSDHGGRIRIGIEFTRWNDLKVALGLKNNEQLAKHLLDAWFKSDHKQLEVTTEDELLSVGSNSRGGGSQQSFIFPSQESVTCSLATTADSTVSFDTTDSSYLPSEGSDEESDDDDDDDDDDEDDTSSINSEDDLYLPWKSAEDELDGIPIALPSDQVYGSNDDQEPQALQGPVGVSSMPALQAVDDKKSLVFETCLLDLANIVTERLNACTKCQSSLKVQTHYVGSAIYLKWICVDNMHTNHVWCSQPKRGNMHLGDFLQSCALLTSGNNFSKLALFHRFLKLGFVNKSSFYRIQRHHCVPVIDDYWQNRQREIWERVSGEELIVSGDGRNDSPGHSAHYCSYILMDTRSKSILDVQVIDKREAELKSPNMEKIGLVRGLRNLQENGLNIKELVTDGHVQIRTMMKNIHPEIHHSMDIWHAGKNFSKKLTALAAETKNQELKPWVPDIVNHFWYSTKTCNGSVEILRAKMKGMLHHVVDVHDWISGDNVSVASCEHDILGPTTKPWLLPDSHPHRALRSVIYDVAWQNKLPYYTNFRHTGDLEVFNNHILMYASKRFSYTYPVYKARNFLAALDFDFHKDRPQMLGKDGKPQYNRIYQKKSKNWSVFDVKEKKSYAYVPELLENMILHYELSNSSLKSSTTLPDSDPRNIASTIAHKRPPATEFLVEHKKSRF